MAIIGAPAIDRANLILREYDGVAALNPSAVFGKVTLVRFFLADTITSCYAATVYVTVPGPPATILTRAKTADLGGFAAGYHEVVTDLAVEPGDYLAFWHNSGGGYGQHDKDNLGGSGMWLRTAAGSPLTGGPGFSWHPAFEPSLEGTIIETVGYSQAHIIG